MNDQSSPTKAEISELVRLLRSHLEFFGSDVSGLTDEEIVQGVMEFAKLCYDAGLETKQAVDTMLDINRILW